MSIMLIFSSMCGLNLRIMRKIAMCYYYTAWMVLENILHVFRNKFYLSFVFFVYLMLKENGRRKTKLSLHIFNRANNLF